MAETLAQLIARGEVIADETVAGANTHTRVGEAILEIPTLLAVPLDLIALRGTWNFTIEWDSFLVSLSFSPTQEARVQPFQITAWGWPYVTGAGIPPNNTGYIKVATSDVGTDLNDTFLDFFDELEAAFGNLEANDGKFCFIQPGIIDVYGREIRFDPIKTLIESGV